MMPRVDAENIEEDDRETDDERQQRPEHTVYNGCLGNNIHNHVARVAGVGKAHVAGAGHAVPLGKTGHGSDVL